MITESTTLIDNNKFTTDSKSERIPYDGRNLDDGSAFLSTKSICKFVGLNSYLNPSLKIINTGMFVFASYKHGYGYQERKEKWQPVVQVISGHAREKEKKSPFVICKVSNYIGKNVQSFSDMLR